MSEPGIAVVETHPVPAQQDELAAAIAAVLALDVSAEVAEAEIEFLLRPWRVGRAAVHAALGLTQTAHRAYARLRANNLPGKGLGADIARAAARGEIYNRAAYLAAAASRIQRDINNGASLPEAVRAEKPNYLRHGKARGKRVDSAANVGLAADRYGRLLGWWRDPESNSEQECLLADRHNFDAIEGTMIGYPGSVHPNCACRPGPPHPGASLVDDALRGYVALTPRKVADVTRVVA